MVNVTDFTGGGKMPPQAEQPHGQSHVGAGGEHTPDNHNAGTHAEYNGLRRPSEDSLQGWPPGFVGYLARHIYDISYKPVREVSIVAALGLMAGICGRAWSVPTGLSSGLNLYVILVASSGTGKEGMFTGISSIIRQVPAVAPYVDFTNYASHQALHKEIARNTCFAHLNNEFGNSLKQMVKANNPVAQGVRTFMTSVFHQSGPNGRLGGIAYSKKDEDVELVIGPAYSMIGDTTPGTFYSALTPDMMEDGFMSRLLVIEYRGETPDSNKYGSQFEALSDAIKVQLERLTTLANTGEQFQRVPMDADAQNSFDGFERHATRALVGQRNESIRQTWNRAAIKALKVACLLAIGDRPEAPLVNWHHMDWAIKLIQNDMSTFLKRESEGDIGDGDDARQKKVFNICREYLLVDLNVAVPKGFTDEDKKLCPHGIIRRSYIQTRASPTAPFKNHLLGPNRALDDILKTMLANGYLKEMDRDKMQRDHGLIFHGKAYQILGCQA